MLLFLGIVLLILAILVFLGIGFLAGDIETGRSPPVRDFWPAAALFLAAILCFVGRHYLRGKGITWALLAGLAFLFAPVANAQAATPATVTWIGPTTFTDGSTIPAATAISYNLYQGASGAEVLLPTPFTSTTYSTTITVTTCWKVTAVIAGQESAPSAEACKSPPKIPSPPTGLTVT
jgi:hypothetical protein